MNTRVTGVFSNRSAAALSARALEDDGFECSLESQRQSPRVQLNSVEINHDRRLILFGLVGMAIGCCVGVFAVSRVTGPAPMYTVIVPLSVTYWGLALGLFVAMAVQRATQLLGKSVADSEDQISNVESGVACVSVQADNEPAVWHAQEIMACFGVQSFALAMVSTQEVNRAPAGAKGRQASRLMDLTA